MKFLKTIYLILILILAVPLISFAASSIKSPLSIFVSIPPQAYFVERIGGDRVAVDILILSGKNPATYSPTFNQIQKLSRARIFFRIGIPIENGLIPKINKMGKKLLIIDTRSGIKMRRLEGRLHQAEKGGIDPHIWLNPKLVKQQAKTIYNALVSLDPAGNREYTLRFKSFIAELDALDKKIKSAFAPIRGKSFFVFHPAFGYFADAYGLRQIAVEIEGKTPRGKDLSIFIKRAIKEKAHVVFVQPQFDKTAAQKIADAINGAVVSIDPLAKDYLHNLEKMAEKISNTFNESFLKNEII